MGFDKGDSAAGFNFGLQIDGVMVEWLQSVSGLGTTQEVIESPSISAQGKRTIGKMPGPVQAGEITITRGTTEDNAFSEWIKAANKGDMGSARKNATIIQMDYQLNPVRRFNLRNAWCYDQQFGEMEANSTEPITETVKITYEELEVE